MKKKKAKKSAPRRKTVKHEIIVRVASQLPQIPTIQELVEPIRDGKSLTIPKTWLSEKQITRMVEKTPPQYIYKRPGKGGGTWDYVTVGYVQRVLDYCFGFNWDFQIVEHGKEADHVWVRGKLTVKSPDGERTISKEQFGRSEVKHKKDSKDMLDYGNDLKSAASDALKKCASMLGIARDIYSKTDYKQESGNTPRDAQTPQLPPPPPAENSEPLYCHGIGKSGCPDGAEINQSTSEYSKKVYGKQLCANCQKLAKPLPKK